MTEEMKMKKEMKKKKQKKTQSIPEVHFIYFKKNANISSAYPSV